MKFIKDVFVLLRDTTWPTRKERWTDFLSVMEYTAFFAVVIYIFDKVVASGLFRIRKIELLRQLYLSVKYLPKCFVILDFMV